VRPSKPPEGLGGGGESLGVFGAPLTSPQNALVKRAASLRQRKFRDREGAFLAEGADVVAAGLAAGRRPQVVFLREELAGELGARLGLLGGGAGEDPGGRPSALDPAGPPPSVFAVDDRVAARLSTLETPADAVAVFPLPDRQPVSSLLGPDSGLDPSRLLVVYADGIQDPGNLGTLVRAAVAFGASALVTGPGSADAFGAKTVRASMGAIFGVPVFADVVLSDVVGRLPVAGVYGFAAHEGAPLDTVRPQYPCVLAVGAERAGLSRRVLEHVTQLVTIPLAPAVAGVVESLNAGVAGAIALYEFSRRSAGASDDPPRRPAAPAKG